MEVCLYETASAQGTRLTSITIVHTIRLQNFTFDNFVKDMNNQLYISFFYLRNIYGLHISIKRRTTIKQYI